MAGQQQPPAWHSDVGVVSAAVSDGTAAQAVALAAATPDQVWEPWRANRGFRRSRINYGGGGGDNDNSNNQAELPAAFRKLGEEALEHARLAHPDAPWDGFALDTLLVNRYHPGDGVAPHRDPESKHPLVLGVTLYENPDSKPSVMEFSSLPDKRTERLRVQTPHRSAYLFHGRAYRNARHSRKASKRQAGLVWSFTFRPRRLV